MICVYNFSGGYPVMELHDNDASVVSSGFIVEVSWGSLVTWDDKENMLEVILGVFSEESDSVSELGCSVL